MPDLNEDIRDWLHRKADWLQHAAEILLNSGSASDDDIHTLVESLKTAEGQRITATRSFDALGPVAVSANALRLLEIGNINGIENLKPRSPLTFGDGSLSVIYGHNGSGKSGYTRLLKRVCGKPRAEALKPNVFEAPPADRKCRIGFQAGSKKSEVEWSASAAPIDELRAVDFFDTDAALFYLREETTAAYTPPAVALFEALASVCDRVKARLDTEQRALISALPALPGEYLKTSTGEVYEGLNPEIDDAKLIKLTDWTERDEQILSELKQRLNVADPAALSVSKRGRKGQVDELATLLRSASAAFGEAGLTDLRASREAAQAKRRIAADAAKVSSAKLEGVGSDTWRAMWKAARNYSQVAYPGKDYPAIDGDSLCLLCQQELDGEAKSRLSDFEGFVQGELEKDAIAAETMYRDALRALPKALTPEEVTTRCQAADLTEESWPQQLGEFWRQVGLAREALLEDELNRTALPISVPEEMAASLHELSEALDREALQHAQDAIDFDRVLAAREKLDLEARRWTSQQAEAIRTEVLRLCQQAQYSRWQLMANSRSISLKAGAIAEQIVTQAFVDRFNRELKALGASRIRVELTKSRMAHGKVLHKLRLRGARDTREKLDAVLSEGERRIVGLAAFLAHMADQPHSTPFVFDDPISSLDHDFEWHVAIRLAELAKSRQVLVFTHRLSLYGAMEDAARKLGDDWMKKNLVKHCIESFSGTAGHPTDQAAWNANTTKANNILLDRLGAAKTAGENGGAEAYKQLAQGICSDFRKLLERTVEDDLLNGIVKRHRRSVTTDNKLKPLPRITPEDCKLVDDLMTKYSCYEHSQSEETPTFLPDELVLRTDLEALKEWREEFKKRPSKVAG